MTEKAWATSPTAYLKMHRKRESLHTGGTTGWDEIYINPRAIITVMKHPTSGETWVNMGPTEHIVKETPEEVMQMLADRYKAWGTR